MNGDERYGVERRRRVALVTAREQPGGAVDLPLLAERLRQNAHAEVVAWDDLAVDWSTFDLALIRSTWDYPGRVAEFLAWADRCAAVTRLANPASLIRWNCDKTYLGALRDSGIPVVPTTYLPPGTAPVVPGDREFVVKPAVGAGALNAARYRPAETNRALEHIRMLHGDGVTVMIQPYLTTLTPPANGRWYSSAATTCTLSARAPCSPAAPATTVRGRRTPVCAAGLRRPTRSPWPGPREPRSPAPTNRYVRGSTSSPTRQATPS
ncbi:ATP-grasp domain-containing protein [Micromonospora kangleipakensis]|uniref:ATP-grasp domain-containing protein n=1 Tax=Micromonospora kangleipakensis TaxID=1077942 RepID=UPI001A9340FF|nr:hypothetical protein [Micromonospora kangleipakensis]